MVNIFTSVSFHCHFGSYELVGFFYFWELLVGFGVCVYIYMKLGWCWTINKIVHMYIKIKHTIFFLMSLVWNLILKVPKLHLSCSHFAWIGIGGYLLSDFLVELFSCCYVKDLHKQEWLIVTVVHVIKQREGNSSRAVVFKCVKKSVLVLQALEGILNLTHPLKCWRRLMITQVTNFPMTGLFLLNLGL